MSQSKQRGIDKLSRIPVKIEPTEAMLRNPDWIRVLIRALTAPVAGIQKAVPGISTKSGIMLGLGEEVS